MKGDTMSIPLLIDGDNLAKRHIMLSAMDDLKSGETFTGGTFGTIRSLAAFLASPDGRMTGPVYAAFDDGVPPYRLERLPNYKGKRKETQKKFTDEQRERIFSQMQDVKRILPMLGVRCLSYRKREADDVLMACTAVVKASGQQPVVMSSDADLLQTIREGAIVYQLDKKRWIGAENFSEVFDVPLDFFVLYRALVGEETDSVTGCPGYGDVRAAKLVNEAAPHLDASLPVGKQMVQLADYVDRTRTEKKKWEEALLSELPRLVRVAEGINLSPQVFGGTKGLTEAMHSPASIDRMGFLRECTALSLSRFLGAPETVLDPFRNALNRG